MPDGVDYRFTLANERTYLAWIRTALALLAGGIAVAKALHFQHEVWRWVLAVPPILGGAALALTARMRWRAAERAMERGEPLPAARALTVIAVAVCVYAVVALVVAAVDGS